MPTVFGAVRSLLMTPSLASVSFAKRGFPVQDTEVTRRLEAIPQSVVCGFEWGIDARNLWEIERRLDLMDPEMCGFGYEGATMAFTIRDAMAGGRGKRAGELMRGPGLRHIFLTYIGIGFAMARLPRPLWKKIVPDLTGVPYHPTMSWLAVDGLGFDRAYFDTRRWVDKQHRPVPYPWEGWPDYFGRAFDQGIGRALWFIHGAGGPEVVAAVRRFDSGRHADLWSGVGLAATFAGGSDRARLLDLRLAAGQYAPDVAQGSVFAAKARMFSGFVPPHTETATNALTGLTVGAASELADAVARDGLDSRSVPEYEVWRRKVRAQVGKPEEATTGDALPVFENENVSGFASPNSHAEHVGNKP